MKTTGELQALTPTPTASQSLVERRAETDSITAYLLAGLYENPDHATAEGLARLTARNRALTSASNDEIMRSVANQASILEALFHRYTLLASDPKLAPAIVEAYMRIAFAAERVFLRAVAVLATLKTMEPPKAGNELEASLDT